MTVKTDRNDARGMAQLMRMGWFRPVHVKTLPAQEVRALLTARKLLQGKLHDIELGIRGLLRGFGLKVGQVSKGRYEARIRELEDLGPYFGLTPSKYQSGEVDWTGRISKVGDVMVRTALFEAANVMLSRVTRFSALKAWALRIAKLRGVKRAKVALARKLAVVLHRMWVDAADFRWRKAAA